MNTPRLKPIALLVQYACYAMGEDWAARNGQHQGTRAALAQLGYTV